MAGLRKFLCAVGLSFAMSGCATYSNRGGVTDLVQDEFIFPADTKQHRALRGYLLIATLGRLGERAALNPNERQALAGDIGRGVEAAAEAFECAYRARGTLCAFFDDRIAELDIMTLQLTLKVLAPPNERDTLASLLQTFRGSSFLDTYLGAGVAVLKAAGASAKAIGETADILPNILNFAAAQYRRGHHLGALWRDSMELDLQIIRDSLCRNRDQLVDADVQAIAAGFAPSRCRKATQALDLEPIDFEASVAYARNLPAHIRGRLIPDARHFMQVSELIWRTCQRIAATAAKRVECRRYGSERDGKEVFAAWKAEHQNLLILGSAVEKLVEGAGTAPGPDQGTLFQAAERAAGKLAGQ